MFPNSLSQSAKTSPTETIRSEMAPESVEHTTQDGLHLAKRGEAIEHTSSDESIDGYDSDMMRGRALLTPEEEKKLLRRIDWHLMPLCSIIFMFKNLDVDNVCKPRLVLYRQLEQALTSVLLGFERPHHEPWDGQKHHETVGHNVGSVRIGCCPVLRTLSPCLTRCIPRTLELELIPGVRFRTSSLRPLPTCYSRDSLPPNGNPGL